MSSRVRRQADEGGRGRPLWGVFRDHGGQVRAGRSNQSGLRVLQRIRRPTRTSSRSALSLDPTTSEPSSWNRHRMNVGAPTHGRAHLAHGWWTFGAPALSRGCHCAPRPGGGVMMRVAFAARSSRATAGRASKRSRRVPRLAGRPPTRHGRRMAWLTKHEPSLRFSSDSPGRSFSGGTGSPGAGGLRGGDHTERARSGLVGRGAERDGLGRRGGRLRRRNVLRDLVDGRRRLLRQCLVRVHRHGC